MILGFLLPACVVFSLKQFTQDVDSSEVNRSSSSGVSFVLAGQSGAGQFGAACPELAEEDLQSCCRPGLQVLYVLKQA